MKVSRVLKLDFICLILIIGSICLLSNSISFLYTSIKNIDFLEKKNTNNIAINISNLASGINNGIDTSSLSRIAMNVDRIEVFDGLTIEELSTKLNKSLNGVLEDKGNLIATKSVELGIDPYMAVAIMLHETGCSYSCSTLATNYYNVGGMKATSSKYQRFSSIDQGINAFLNNLYKNYYQYGLNTPEKINTKYAASTSWASKIRSYMDKIRNC